MPVRVDRSANLRGRQPERTLAAEPIRTGIFSAGPRYGCKRWSGTDDWLLFCITGGAGRFGHAGGSLVCGPGELVLLSPRHPHDYATATPPGVWEFTWAHFLPPPHWLPWLAWPEVAPGLHRLTLGADPAFAAIAGRLRDMDQLATSARRQRYALAINALESAVLLADECVRHEVAVENRVRQAADTITADVARAWSIADMAIEAGLSESRFAHRFRAEFGETPRRWLERQRIERARQLLHDTSDPIKDIAAAVGFSDPFHFTSRFRAVTGMTPSQIRKRG